MMHVSFHLLIQVVLLSVPSRVFVRLPVQRVKTVAHTTKLCDRSNSISRRKGLLAFKRTRPVVGVGAVLNRVFGNVGDLGAGRLSFGCGCVSGTLCDHVGGSETLAG